MVEPLFRLSTRNRESSPAGPVCWGVTVTVLALLIFGTACYVGLHQPRHVKIYTTTIIKGQPASTGRWMDLSDLSLDQRRYTKAGICLSDSPNSRPWQSADEFVTRHVEV